MMLLEHTGGSSWLEASLTPVLLGLIAGALTLAASLFLPFAVRPLLEQWGIMDVPNERSSHTRPILRGLGLAVLIAMVVVGIVSVLLLWLADRPGWATLLVCVVGFACSGLLGLREDLSGLSVRARSIALLAIGLVTPALLFLVSDPAPTIAWIAGAPGAPSSAIAVTALIVYAVLFTSSYINVANFMDGLNGISGFHGTIAGVAFAVAGAATGREWLTLAGLVLAAGFLGFLPWNLTKPGAFLGDVGSYLLGGAVAITSFAALMSGVPFLATIGPMVIYFGDVGVTLVKRVRAGKRWDEPHKEHTYQRIQQLGYSHVAASAMAAGCTFVTSALGLLAIATGLIGTLVLLLGGVAVLVLYLALPKLLPAR